MGYFFYFNLIKFNMDVKINTKYKINKFNLENKDVILLLNNLGICENENVMVLKSNYGNNSLLVNVSGINYALDKKVCAGIIVK